VARGARCRLVYKSWTSSTAKQRGRRMTLQTAMVKMRKAHARGSTVGTRQARRQFLARFEDQVDPTESYPRTSVPRGLRSQDNYILCGSHINQLRGGWNKRSG